MTTTSINHNNRHFSSKLLLLFLFFFAAGTILLLQTPKQQSNHLISDGIAVDASSQFPMPEQPGKNKNDRWKGDRNYKGKCNQKTVLAHVLCGHGFKSKMTNKSKFLKQYSNKSSLKQIGNQVYGQGNWAYQSGSNTWKVTLDMGKAIGKDLAGQTSQIVQLIVNSQAEILTMFVI